ncbi:MAG: hypothetical protein H7Z14_10235 [Anaerolineae bacterium]|nr:hypothetical protein [Phycisphaerae bacterium]
MPTARPLFLTKSALAMMLLGLAVVGRRNAFWPLVNWGMYSKKPIHYPAPTATAVRLRIVDSTGQLRLVSAHELWGVDRLPIAMQSFTGAFDAETADARAAHRGYLVHLLDNIFPAIHVKQVQGVRLTWSVEPMAVPPLILAAPERESILGTFDADAHRRRAKRRP